MQTQSSLNDLGQPIISGRLKEFSGHSKRQRVEVVEVVVVVDGLGVEVVVVPLVEVLVVVMALVVDDA